MATVFQFIATDAEHENFESELLNGDWHVGLSLDNRTVCGIQLDGDDGYAAGPEKTGVVTCPICLCIIDEIKGIRNWKPKRRNERISTE